MMSSYLIHSFQRKPLRHLSILWIMLCAFLLPLVVSVYRDSLAYGVQLQNFDFHKGQAIHIIGAQPEDVELFQNIEGLTQPYYEDGIVYMTYDSKESEERFREVHELIALGNLLKSKAHQSGRNLEVMTYDPSQNMLNDPYMQTTLGNMQRINLALLLFSGLIVQAAYRNHIDSFSEELVNLSAIGAARGQISGMFLVEFLVLFPLAAAGAVGISYGVMHLLYEKYLGNMAASTAIWRVFHMDAQSTALQIGFYLLVCLGAMGYALRKKPAKPRMGKPRKTASLPRLWMERTRTPFISCLAILVPLVAAFVILFNQYLSTYADLVYSSQDAEIKVTSATGKGFLQETVDAISAVDGVNQVETTWDFSEPFLLDSPRMGALMVSLHLSDELSVDSPQLGKDQFIADFDESLESEESYSLSRISSPGQKIPVTLAKRIPVENADNSLNVYVSRELLQEFAKTAGYTKLSVYTTASRASAVEQELRLMFSESALISNFQNYVDTAVLQQEGNLWLLSWIFSILMIAAMQIVWAMLSRYVRDCAPMLQIIRHVGASRKQVSRLIPAHFGAIPGVVLPFLIAIPWAWMDSYRNGRPFILSVPVVGIYLAVAALVAAAFCLPVKMMLKRILK